MSGAAPVAAMTILELSDATSTASPAEPLAAESAGLASLVVRRAFRVAYAVEPGVLLPLSPGPETWERWIERLRWTGFAALPELVAHEIPDAEVRAPVGRLDLLKLPVDFVFEEDFRPAAFSH